MGYLWDIAQAHLDAYGVRAAALARRMGTSPQTLDSWKNRGVRSLPSRELLEALAKETRTPYPVVLEAALRDTDYLPKEGDRSGDTAATKQARDDAGLTVELWDQRAAPLRAAGYTERAIVDALGTRPVDDRLGEGAGEVAGGASHNDAGHGVDDRRRRLTS